MGERQVSEFSLEIPIQTELAYRNKVPCPKKEVVKTMSRTPSFKEWMDSRSIELYEEPTISPKVQSFIEMPKLPSSSPGPQDRMGQISIKNEPYSSELYGYGPLTPYSTSKDLMIWPNKISDEFHIHNSSDDDASLEKYMNEPSGMRSPNSAEKDWIGPSILSLEPPPLVPPSAANLILNGNVSPPRPHSIQRTNMARPRTRSPNHQVHKPNSSPSVPTKPPLGLKRKATTAETEQVHMRQSPSPWNSNNNITNNTAKKSKVDSLICKLCQVSCSSALTMHQHLIGRAHKAKLEYMERKKSVNIMGSRKLPNPRCDVCQIWCSDSDTLEMHFKGQKHKAKLRELELSKKNGGAVVDKKPILCELCRVHCMNEDLFKMHLKGRQHAYRAELKRRGML